MQPFPVPVLPAATSHPAAHRAGGQRRPQLPPAAHPDPHRSALAGARGRGRRAGLGRGRIRAARGHHRRLLAARSRSGRVSRDFRRRFPEVDLVTAGGATAARRARAAPTARSCSTPCAARRTPTRRRGTRRPRSNNAKLGARPSGPAGMRTMPLWPVRLHGRDPPAPHRQLHRSAATDAVLTPPSVPTCCAVGARSEPQPSSGCRNWSATPPACSRSAAASAWWRRA